MGYSILGPAGNLYIHVHSSKISQEAAETENGIIMGIEHKEFNVHGVQFHPESIKTTIGIKILKNFINYKK